MTTVQESFWSGEFGDQYTNRNINIDQSTYNKFGITRTAMNQDFLDCLDINTVLEVGCNRGEQLNCLYQSNKERDYYGIDINEYALHEARENNLNLNVIKGSALNIPFKDNYFDLVFTSGVLIHIHPDNLKHVMSEIYRCSKKYIWSFEYFSVDCKEINYRNNEGFLWKNNFSRLYQEYFPDLKLIKEEFYEYKDGSGNIDNMFLLTKEIL
jgi:pseudaminic acid biosynthesis-associated methylase